jgi:hypothetical protein
MPYRLARWISGLAALCHKAKRHSGLTGLDGRDAPASSIRFTGFAPRM